jgi:hypothetical protein
LADSTVSIVSIVSVVSIVSFVSFVSIVSISGKIDNRNVGGGTCYYENDSQSDGPPNVSPVFNTTRRDIDNESVNVAWKRAKTYIIPE